MSLRCLSVLLAALGAAGCSDTRIGLPDARPPGQIAGGVRQVPLRPGMPVLQPPRENPYAGDPHALQEGERLYNWMNCSGCHFAGGGGIGPPLLDDVWIYGGRPEQIFDTVVNGRANGMPAYGDKLVVDEIWRIVAYVESLSEQAQEEAGE